MIVTTLTSMHLAGIAATEGLFAETADFSLLAAGIHPFETGGGEFETGLPSVPYGLLQAGGAAAGGPLRGSSGLWRPERGGKNAVSETAIQPAREIPQNGTTDPATLLEIIRSELAKIENRLASVRENVPEEKVSGYEKELGVVRSRIAYWGSALRDSENQFGMGKERFREDILIGERILLHRLVQTGASVFSEPISGDSVAGVGLRSGVGQFRSVVGHSPDQKGRRGEILPSLINLDVGFGRNLTLRPHQAKGLDKLRGILRMTRDSAFSREAAAELLHGTVDMPVGGGKTRLMVASFAAAVESGVYDLRRGDVMIVLNHTDQIHDQNGERVFSLLKSFFRRVCGIRLRVTEYKAEKRDVSGHVVVVSIPTLNNPNKLEAFKKALRKRLGSGGKIAVVAIDEIHHLSQGRRGKATWQRTEDALREITPDLFRIGFTATPTGEEGPYLVRVRELDLMRAGVTPRTYLVKSSGADLTRVKVVRSSGDFDKRRLEATLLSHPEVNEALFLQLERWGMRRDRQSPSGRELLEASLGRCVDLRHAAMVAAQYADFFGRTGEGLRGRKILYIGRDRGKITAETWGEALAQYIQGEIDTVVAVVSSSTPPDVRREILKGVENGTVELALHCGIWDEGADLPMFAHGLGLCPTFSASRKSQERGRLNRRGKKDTAPDGRLVSDTPKILFEVVHECRILGRHLVLYGEVMGLIGYAGIGEGELFDVMASPMEGLSTYADLNEGELLDVMTGRVVEEVDREGRGVVHRNFWEVSRAKPVRKSPREIPQEALATQLWTILEKEYEGDVEAMSLDLGLSVAQTEALLKGRCWINAYWFFNRLSTLLYQKRSFLLDLKNDLNRGSRGEPVSEADHSILQGALSLYEAWDEGALLEPREIEVRGDAGRGEQRVVITANQVADLARRKITDVSWYGMWQGLYLYFSSVSRQEGPHQQEAFVQRDRLRRRFFERQDPFPWAETASDPEDSLLLAARDLTALKFGSNRIPIGHGVEGIGEKDLALNRWLKGEKIEFGKNFPPKTFYNQIFKLLVHLGMPESEAKRLIIEAVFAAKRREGKGWSLEKPTTKEGTLLQAARKLLSWREGGQLPSRHGYPGVDLQKNRNSTVTLWLEEGEAPFNRSRRPRHLYSQIYHLLVGMGMSGRKAGKLVTEAVCERKGWLRTEGAETREAELLWEARQLLALKRGGDADGDFGIEGIPPQSNKEAVLRRWLEGEALARYLVPRKLYPQIYRLLTAYGMEPKQAGRLVFRAVAEERGDVPDPLFGKNNWLHTSPVTREERVLCEARELLAIYFGGVRLGTIHGIPGVSVQNADKGKGGMMDRWLQTGQQPSSHQTAAFHEQVYFYFVGLGMDRQRAKILAGDEN